MIKRAAVSGRRSPIWILAAILSAAMIGTGHAANEAGTAGTPQWVSAPEQIAVTGIITRIAEENLHVSFGGGELTVSMIGWEWYESRTNAKGMPPRLNVGENVTVTGAVDAELFRRRILRAQSIYVRDRHSFFVGSSPKANEAPWSLRPMPVAPDYGGDPTTVSLAGAVVRIAGDEFSLDVGESMVSIDTGAMSYNPLDDIGAQKVRTGDWVQVSGRLDNRLFTDRRLDASRITKVFRMNLHAM